MMNTTACLAEWSAIDGGDADDTAMTDTIVNVGPVVAVVIAAAAVTVEGMMTLADDVAMPDQRMIAVPNLVRYCFRTYFQHNIVWEDRLTLPTLLVALVGVNHVD